MNLCLLLTALAPCAVAGIPTQPGRDAAKALAGQPLAFEENQGQAGGDAQYVCRSRRGIALLRRDGLVLTLSSGQKASLPFKARAEAASGAHSLETRVMRMELVHANPAAVVEAEEKLGGTSNYFIGNEERNWHAGIPRYARVRYKSVYPRIDIAYYGNDRQLEYDLLLAPHADARLVRLRFAGQDKLRLNQNGDVVLDMSGRAITLEAPFAYQMRNGQKHRIDAWFVAMGQREIGFRLGSYDPAQPLIIDPKLVYSSYLGGSDDEGIFGIAFDPEGNLYVAGETSSVNFPTSPLSKPAQSKLAGNYDAFVSKFDRTGTQLIYSTYLGGSLYDHAVGLAVDDHGGIYVAGLTQSADFPTAHALQPRLAGNYDAFVTRLSPSGSSLVYSTYLGGKSYDQAAGIRIDAEGNAYIAGSTYSTDFPVTAHSLQTTCDQGAFPDHCNGDGFVAKLNAAGTQLVYATYLGGRGSDQANGIDIDKEGAVYVAGSTTSNNFPIKGGFQPILAGYQSGFITKLAQAGDSLVYSSYLGGSGSNGATAVAIDVFNNAYVTGYTDSLDFPTMNPFQPKLAGKLDAFVTKVNADGATLNFSTYLGGSDIDYPLSIAVDAAGHPFVTGLTYSKDFPVLYALQDKFKGGTSDVFVSRFLYQGEQLSYSTYLGGSGDDFGYAIHVDLTGTAYVGGSTSSLNFPVQNAFQRSYNGGPFDAFLSELALEPTQGLETLEAAVNDLVVTGTIDEKTAAALYTDLADARTALAAKKDQAAIANIFAYESLLEQDVQAGSVPVFTQLRLAYAGYSVLDLLGAGPL